MSRKNVAKSCVPSSKYEIPTIRLLSDQPSQPFSPDIRE